MNRQRTADLHWRQGQGGMNKRTLVFCAGFLAGFTLALLVALPLFADDGRESAVKPPVLRRLF